LKHFARKKVGNAPDDRSSVTMAPNRQIARRLFGQSSSSLAAEAQCPNLACSKQHRLMNEQIESQRDRLTLMGIAASAKILKTSAPESMFSWQTTPSSNDENKGESSALE